MTQAKEIVYKWIRECGSVALKMTAMPAVIAPLVAAIDAELLASRESYAVVAETPMEGDDEAVRKVRRHIAAAIRSGCAF